jgi:hypothetical protein
MMDPSLFYHPFMNPWNFPQGQASQGPTQGSAGSGVKSANYSAPSEAIRAADAQLEFPDSHDWVEYCDRVPRRSRANLGQYGDKLIEEGFLEIIQLTRVSPRDLAASLGIGLGLAELITTYAQEDVDQVWAGAFNMDLSY